MKEREAVFHAPRWSWASTASDYRNAYMAMDGRVSLAELIAHLRQVAPSIPIEEIRINFGTVTWSRPATEEEMADRAERLAEQQARQTEWERKTLAQLLWKYAEDDDPPTNEVPQGCTERTYCNTVEPGVGHTEDPLRKDSNEPTIPDRPNACP